MKIFPPKTLEHNIHFERFFSWLNITVQKIAKGWNLIHPNGVFRGEFFMEVIVKMDGRNHYPISLIENGVFDGTLRALPLKTVKYQFPFWTVIRALNDNSHLWWKLRSFEKRLMIRDPHIDGC